VKNPNAHLFNIKNIHREGRFDYQKVKQSNTNRQPVLFEYLDNISLTRSEYIITSYIDFGQYYEGFNDLENYANKLYAEISKLADTKLPYFMRTNDDSERALLNVIDNHKEEVVKMMAMLEAHKLHFSKIIDHVELATDDFSKTTAKRPKRSILLGIVNWLFGGNDNSATIKQIKRNLEILEANQQTLGSEITRNLEMISNNNVEISKNRALLNSLNKELVQLNHSMSAVITGLRAVAFSRNFIYAILQIRNRFALFRDGLDNLRMDLVKIEEYMSSLTSHSVTPNLIPPTDLREILQDVVQKLESNPKLALPQVTNIWSYYQFLKIDAFVHQDVLIVLLVLPLIDRDLQFEVYKAHNLPLLHPELKKVFTYKLPSPYLAIRADGNYLTLPIHDDILTCTISAGHFCNLNTPLYPTRSSKQCIYNLLMNQEEQIKENCELEIENYQQDQAINLEQNIWALSVLEVPTELHITCLTYSYEIAVTTNFQLIELDNSCQAYNPNFIIPSSNIMKEEQNSSIIKDRFLNYDPEYTSIPNFFLMQTFNLTLLSQEQISQIAVDLPPIQSISVHNISELLNPIDKDYPFELPLYAYVGMTVGVTTLVILIIGIVFYARYRRARAVHSTLKRRQPPPSKDQIEMQPLTLTTTNKQIERKRPVTPQLVKKKLEEDFNIDFSTYDRKKRSREMSTVV